MCVLREGEARKREGGLIKQMGANYKQSVNLGKGYMGVS